MKLRLQLFLVVILFVICLLPSAVRGEDPGLSSVFYHGFDNDGYFCVIPQEFGNYTGLIIGAVPSALVAGTCHLFYAQDDVSIAAAKKTMWGFSSGCGFCFGVPFKVIKLICWDFPGYICADFLGDTNPPLPVKEPLTVTEK
jgi:hypothetical protein